MSLLKTCRLFCNVWNIYPKFSVHKCCIRTRQYKDMKQACLLVADGSEEMETVITADILRRGEIKVHLTSVDSPKTVTFSRNVVLVPDMSLAEALEIDYDMVILPGGLKGAETFCKNPDVGKLLKKQEAGNKFIAAICAAPTALKAHSIHPGKALTSHPALSTILKTDTRYKYLHHKVVIDGMLITSRGPGMAIPFAFTLLERLQGADKAAKVAEMMLIDYEVCVDGIYIEGLSKSNIKPIKKSEKVSEEEDD